MNIINENQSDEEDTTEIEDEADQLLKLLTDEQKKNKAQTDFVLTYSYQRKFLNNERSR